MERGLREGGTHIKFCPHLFQAYDMQRKGWVHSLKNVILRGVGSLISNAVLIYFTVGTCNKRGGGTGDTPFKNIILWGKGEGGHSYQIISSLISLLWHTIKGMGTLSCYDGKGRHSYQMLPSFTLLLWHAMIKWVGHSLKTIMLFDATCCLHPFLLFTRVSRVLTSEQ